jgi:hypothetical protein
MNSRKSATQGEYARSRPFFRYGLDQTAEVVLMIQMTNRIGLGLRPFAVVSS